VIEPFTARGQGDAPPQIPYVSSVTGQMDDAAGRNDRPTGAACATGQFSRRYGVAEESSISARVGPATCCTLARSTRELRARADVSSLSDGLGRAMPQPVNALGVLGVGSAARLMRSMGTAPAAISAYVSV